jgi:TonB family protein
MKFSKDDRSALLGTLAFHGLLLLAILFMGLSYQVPPPEERGVEVNLGFSDQGMGNNPSVDPVDMSSRMPSASQRTNEVVTQSTEETYAINQKKVKPDQTVEQPKQTESTTPTVDPRLLYTGKKNQGTSEGITGQPGNQGQPDGDPNASNYTGSPGTGGGISYDLGGRKAKAIPKPNYDSEDQGKVIVTIWVDREGRVINAVSGAKGSTTSSSQLRRLAEEAARRALFLPNPGGPEVQVGTITYTFIKLN